VDADRDKNARIVTVTRPIKMNDIVIIDFQGYINDEPFENGHGENHQLTIGSHTFIGDFEEQLIGSEICDSIFVRVKFPEDYGNEKLSGKPAVFDVKIKEIQEKELPDPDDDFAQDVSEFDSFAEYRESIVSRLTEIKKKNGETNKETQILDKLSAMVQVDVPPVMIEDKMDEMLQNFQSQLQYQGVDFNSFLQYTGQTKEQMREHYYEKALSQVKANLALLAIAKKERIEPAPEEIEEESKQICIVYSIDPKNLDLDIVRKEILYRKAYNFVMEHAVEVA
jgi:trigger factor